MSQYMWQQSIDKHLSNLESDINTIDAEIEQLADKFDVNSEEYETDKYLLCAQKDLILEEIYQTKQRDYFTEYADYQYDQMKERQLNRGY